MFNSREVATGIWFFVLLTFALTKADIRKQLRRLFRVSLQPKLLLSFLCMLLYVVLIVWGLHRVGFWHVTLLKDTIWWFLLTALGVAMNSITSDKPGVFLSQSIHESLRLIIVIQFLVNTYTFNLVLEIFLVPLLSIIAMMDAFVERKSEYAEVVEVIHWIHGGIGLVILATALGKAISDYSNLLSMEALRSLLLAPVLTASFLPFAYAVALYSNYERIFVWLKIGWDKDDSTIRYAKRVIFSYSGFSLNRVTEVNKQAVKLRYTKTKDDIDEFLRSV
ncbi:MAG: hypothetical protein GX977_10590 [Firmicutes bacterium]|nr:hypothetical protein [Bacillota bacterium]